MVPFPSIHSWFRTFVLKSFINNHFYILLKALSNRAFSQIFTQKCKQISAIFSSDLETWFLTSVTFGLFPSTRIEPVGRSVCENWQIVSQLFIGSVPTVDVLVLNFHQLFIVAFTLQILLLGINPDCTKRTRWNWQCQVISSSYEFADTAAVLMVSFVQLLQAKIWRINHDFVTEQKPTWMYLQFWADKFRARHPIATLQQGRNNPSHSHREKDLHLQQTFNLTSVVLVALRGRWYQWKPAVRSFKPPSLCQSSVSCPIKA